jgi:hypothetical protein
MLYSSKARKTVAIQRMSMSAMREMLVHSTSNEEAYDKKVDGVMKIKERYNFEDTSRGISAQPIAKVLIVVALDRRLGSRPPQRFRVELRATSLVRRPRYLFGRSELK